MDKVSPQIRILAVVLVLVGAAGMLAMRMLGPSVPAEVAVTPAVQTPAKAKPTPAKAAKPAAKPIKTAAKPAAKTPAKPAAKPAPKPAPKPVVKTPALNAPKPDLPPSGFPVQVDAALRKHAVLVVSLVVPGARVDELAANEARAGAKLGGAGFLALNLLNENVARALMTKLEGPQQPSLLVLKRSGDVALAVEGFVDRETVAQAAENAST
jgi:outer membrane biosynthesis protein TonB